MFKNFDERRKNFLQFALLDVLLPLIDDPENGNGYIQMRRKQLGSESSPVAPWAPLIPASDFVPPPQPPKLSLDEGTTVVTPPPATNTTPLSSPLSKTALKKMAKAAKAQQDASTTTMITEPKVNPASPNKEISASAEDASTDAIVVDQIVSTPISYASTVTTPVQTKDSWFSLPMLKAHAQAAAVSWWTGVDSPGLTRDKIQHAEKFVHDMKRLLAMLPNSKNALRVDLEALQKNINAVQANLSELRETYSSDNGELEGIFRVFTEAINWLSEERVRLALELIMNNDAKLNADLNYANVSMQFFSDLFRIAFYIKVDALCGVEHARVTLPRVLPDAPGEILIKTILSQIEQHADYEKYVVDQNRRITQLSTVATAIAKIVGDEQSMLEKKRMLPATMSGFLSTVLPSSLITPRNRLLDEMLELITEHQDKIVNLQKGQANRKGFHAA